MQYGSCDFTVRYVGDVAIIDSSGRITLSGGATGLRETIYDLAKRGYKKVLLNLAETSYVDSSGIAEMVSGFSSLANQGAVLKLLALGPRVESLLRITKLYTVFEIYKDEIRAVRSFAA